MRLIKILVGDEDQAKQLNEVIEEAECNLDIDFPFTVRVTDELSHATALHNLYHEEELL